jgi:hypothetical protein
MNKQTTFFFSSFKVVRGYNPRNPPPFFGSKESLENEDPWKVQSPRSLEAKPLLLCLQSTQPSFSSRCFLAKFPSNQTSREFLYYLKTEKKKYSVHLQVSMYNTLKKKKIELRKRKENFEIVL